MTTHDNYFDPDIMIVNRWTSASSIEWIITRHIPKFFLWKVSVEEVRVNEGPFRGIHLNVVVTLYPWSWLWLGRKQHRYMSDLYKLHGISRLKFPVRITVR